MRHVEKYNSSLFFKYNTALGPPYQVLIDTNFINFSIRNKIDLVQVRFSPLQKGTHRPPTLLMRQSTTATAPSPLQGMVECLYAKCTPCITDCVMAELEKLGQKYRVALKIAKDPRQGPPSSLPWAATAPRAVHPVPG